MNSWILIVTVVFSFWWIDRAMGNWKKEQDEKLEDINNTVNDLYREFQEKFSEDEDLP